MANRRARYFISPLITVQNSNNLQKMPIHGTCAFPPALLAMWTTPPVDFRVAKQSSRVLITIHIVLFVPRKTGRVPCLFNSISESFNYFISNCSLVCSMHWRRYKRKTNWATKHDSINLIKNHPIPNWLLRWKIESISLCTTRKYLVDLLCLISYVLFVNLFDAIGNATQYRRL